MKCSVFFEFTVRPKDGTDSLTLVDGLKKLSNQDLLVVCTAKENDEHVIAGRGELHVEICMKGVHEKTMRGFCANLMNRILYAASIHEGAGQIMPPTRRCCSDAEMLPILPGKRQDPSVRPRARRRP